MQNHGCSCAEGRAGEHSCCRNRRLYCFGAVDEEGTEQADALPTLNLAGLFVPGGLGVCCFQHSPGAAVGFLSTVWGAPGLCDYLLTEDLLTKETRSKLMLKTSKQLRHSFTEEEPGALHMMHFVFNLLVATAVQFGPMHVAHQCTATDFGRGPLRHTTPQCKMQLISRCVPQAVSRALALWTDPAIRYCCRGALHAGSSLCAMVLRHCTENGLNDDSDEEAEMDLLSIERGAGSVDRLFLVHYALEDFGLNLLDVLQTCLAEMHTESREPGLGDYVADMLGTFAGRVHFGPNSLWMPLHFVFKNRGWNDKEGKARERDPEATRIYESQFSVHRASEAAVCLLQSAFEPDSLAKNHTGGHTLTANTVETVCLRLLGAVCQPAPECLAVWQRCASFVSPPTDSAHGRDQKDAKSAAFFSYVLYGLAWEALMPLACCSKEFPSGRGGQHLSPLESFRAQLLAAASHDTGNSSCDDGASEVHAHAPPEAAAIGQTQVGKSDLLSLFGRLPADGHALRSILMFCVDPSRVDRRMKIIMLSFRCEEEKCADQLAATPANRACIGTVLFEACGAAAACR